MEQTKDLLWTALETGGPFYFLRFGDGDLFLIDGEDREMHHINSPELRRDLTESICIEGPGFYKASIVNTHKDSSGSFHCFVPRNMKHDVKKGQLRMKRVNRDLRRIQEMICGDSTFYHLHVFQHVFEHEITWFNSWLKMLEGKKVLFIAGDKLCGSPLVKKMYNVKTEIAFPGTNDAYYHFDEFLPEIMKQVPEHDVIIPVIGMATRVLGKILYTSGYEDKIFIDIGVITDALSGVRDRYWSRRMKDEGIIDKYKEINHAL